VQLSHQEFQRVSKKTELRGGGTSLGGCKALGDLPSKEQLMAQIAGALNALATKIAVSINEVPASLGRSIGCVGAGSRQQQRHRYCVNR